MREGRPHDEVPSVVLVLFRAASHRTVRTRFRVSGSPVTIREWCGRVSVDQVMAVATDHQGCAAAFGHGLHPVRVGAVASVESKIRQAWSPPTQQPPSRACLRRSPVTSRHTDLILKRSVSPGTTHYQQFPLVKNVCVVVRSLLGHAHYSPARVVGRLRPRRGSRGCRPFGVVVRRRGR
jgi:hypothetical protein